MKKLYLGLKGPLEIYEVESGFNILYYTEDIEVITKDNLEQIISFLGSTNIKLFTNCGLDLHSSVLNYKNILVNKFSYFDYMIIRDDIHI